jgi:hypothetical protein
MKTDFSTHRRNFLKHTAILGGLGLLSMLGYKKTKTAEMKNVSPAASVNGQGYRLTEQIKKYYETARL